MLFKRSKYKIPRRYLICIARDGKLTVLDPPTVFTWRGVRYTTRHNGFLSDAYFRVTFSKTSSYARRYFSVRPEFRTNLVISTFETGAYSPKSGVPSVRDPLSLTSVGQQHVPVRADASVGARLVRASSHAARVRPLRALVDVWKKETDGRQARRARAPPGPACSPLLRYRNRTRRCRPAGSRRRTNTCSCRTCWCSARSGTGRRVPRTRSRPPGPPVRAGHRRLSPV